MITGFNTDIDYNGVTYHVQTEDKGLDTPLILSLVYNRGTILASKRSPYNDLLLGEFNEKELAERLHRQHKLICAAIRAGRIEDLKKMNAKGVAKRQESATKIETSSKLIQVAAAQTQVQIETEKKVETVIEEMPLPVLLQKEETKEPEPIKKPEIELPAPEPKIETPKIEFKEEILDAPIEITDADLIFEDTQNLEEVIMIPDEAIEIITSFSEPEEISAEDRLFIELLNEVDFRGGESKTVSILVGRGKDRIPLVSVNLMIKILSSSFRPLIFHTKTDSNGVAIVHLQIPPFSRGRAAVLIKAMSNSEDAELRRIIHPG